MSLGVPWWLPVASPQAAAPNLLRHHQQLHSVLCVNSISQKVASVRLLPWCNSWFLAVHNRHTNHPYPSSYTLRHGFPGYLYNKEVTGRAGYIVPLNHDASQRWISSIRQATAGAQTRGGLIHFLVHGGAITIHRLASPSWSCWLIVVDNSW